MIIKNISILLISGMMLFTCTTPGEKSTTNSEPIKDTLVTIARDTSDNLYKKEIVSEIQFYEAILKFDSCRYFNYKDHTKPNSTEKIDMLHDCNFFFSDENKNVYQFCAYTRDGEHTTINSYGFKWKWNDVYDLNGYGLNEKDYERRYLGEHFKVKWDKIIIQSESKHIIEQGKIVNLDLIEGTKNNCGEKL